MSNFDESILLNKSKRKTNGRPPHVYKTPPADDVHKHFAFALQVANLNTGRVSSPEELADRFDKLFELAFQSNIIPRYEHLILASGLPKRTFFDYGNEEGLYSASQNYSPTIKKAKMLISSMEASLAASGKIPAPVYIFREKNYGGLKDVQEIQAVAPPDVTKPKNAEEILDELPDNPTKMIDDK